MKCIVLAVALVAALSGVSFAGGDGSTVMEFPAKNGTVVFNHAGHVKALKRQCSACHDVPGQIKGFDKTMAHKLCIGCHQPEGEEPIGPIVCDGCHAKR